MRGKGGECEGEVGGNGRWSQRRRASCLKSWRSAEVQAVVGQSCGSAQGYSGDKGGYLCGVPVSVESKSESRR